MNEMIIDRYAKKIYGFAYSKTGNYNDACDLSQDILLEVCKTDFTKKEIFDLDGYIYRLCRYTWSNHVRKNSGRWDNTYYCDVMPEVVSDYSLEEQVLKTDLFENLRREVMFLAKTKRDVTVMFYYEGKSGKEISDILGIPEATVRWHLGEAKKKIRENIEMENNIYTPKKLKVGFCGNCYTPDMKGLRNDLLVQNICLACQGKALTVEEIAHVMCMSAAFIEEKLDDMLMMNYLERVGANKYRCTFLIRDSEHMAAVAKFYMDTDAEVAKAAYEAIEARFDRILSIGFLGSDIDRDVLMWTFVGEALFAFSDDYGIDFEFNPPKRGDGSEFYVLASYKDVKIDDPKLATYLEKFTGSCGTHGCNGSIVVRRRNPACVVSERGLLHPTEVTEIEKVISLKGKADLNKFDKEVVARVCKVGLAEVVDGEIKLTVPYFTAEQFEEFKAIIDEAAGEICDTCGHFAREYAEYIEKYIPAWVPEGDRILLKNHYMPVTSVLYVLNKDGKLRDLTEKEKKGVCTIVFEEKH